MTANQSLERRIHYVILAMLTAAGAGVMTVDFSQPRQVAVFVLAVLAAGVNTSRSYIDVSPSQVTPTPEDPKVG